MPQRWLSKFRSIVTPKDIYDASLVVCYELGMDFFFHIADVPASSPSSPANVVSNLIDNEIDASKIMTSPDAGGLLSILRGCSNITPTIWSNISDIGLPISTRDYFLTDGVMVGMHGAQGRAMMCFAVKDGSFRDRDMETILCMLHVMSPYVYTTLTCRPADVAYSLSSREHECLEWLVQGKTSWEIGKIMGIAERTANFHVGNILRKMKCHNRSQVIRKAMLTLQISPDTGSFGNPAAASR